MSFPQAAVARPPGGLDDYLATYRDLFTRADQARSFGLYVRGLLERDYRKNVESMAGRLEPTAEPAGALAQSLHHFVTQSPWDSGAVIARYRAIAAPTGGGRTWVVHDGIVPKKGRYSVGVQRQFARSLGRKVNCQVAVVISDVTSRCIPLTARLYLPANWLREHEARARQTIPETFRRPRSKAEVAVELLEELAGVARPNHILAEDGYASAPDFADGVGRLGIMLADNGADSERGVQAARECFDYLKDAIGLSHFEGRTWVGWHHHLALVLAAFGFLGLRE